MSKKIRNINLSKILVKSFMNFLGNPFKERLLRKIVLDNPPAILCLGFYLP